MHQTISYAGLSREEADQSALADMLAYLGVEAFDAAIDHIQGDERFFSDPAAAIQGLNFSFGFAGVSGLSFHAFCRKYARQAYREWLATGDEIVHSDSAGFALSFGEFAIPDNDPAKAGELAAPKKTFGWCSRFAIAPVHTRGGLQWFVWDAHKPDDEGNPTIIRQEPFEDGLDKALADITFGRV